MIDRKQIPVIDLFAGPGGLGEGFSSIGSSKNKNAFKITLSIEKETFAHQTLVLRAFFREFSGNSAPDAYYQFLKGQISQETLFNQYTAQAQSAEKIAWCAELGNINPDIVDLRISEAISGQNKWVLIGGPPCQAYSIAGRSRNSKIWRDDPQKKENDKKHFLYREYLRILEIHRPPVFVLENVRGMLSSSVSEGKIADLIFKDLKNLGYRLFSCVSKKYEGKEYFSEGPFHPAEFIIQSEDYGIPQKRHRVIILGIRGNLDYIIPSILQKKEEHVSLGNSIGDLPELRSGLSKAADSSEEWYRRLRELGNNGILDSENIDIEVKNEILRNISKLSYDIDRGSEFIDLARSPLSSFEPEWFFDPMLNGVCNHSSRGHILLDLYRYFFASCFAKVKHRTPKLSDFPKTLLPNHANVQDGVDGKLFSDRFRVQQWEHPSTTITSHISKDGHYYIHPDPLQCRSLTVREAARLQTFPDNYFFLGPRTAQYVQVGNAVPPLLAKQIAEIVRDIIWQIR